MLCRFRLELPNRLQVGDKSNVYKCRLPSSHLTYHLSDCFEKGHCFDVADCSSNLNQQYVRLLFLYHVPNPFLDSVSDMGNDLNSSTKKASFPFSKNY